MDAQERQGKGHQLFMMAAFAANTQEAMLQTPALNELGEFLLHIVRERALPGDLMFQKRQVVLLKQLVQECLFGLMALVDWFVRRCQFTNG